MRAALATLAAAIASLLPAAAHAQNPLIEQAIKFDEFHFEIRLTPAARAEYADKLQADLDSSRMPSSFLEQKRQQVEKLTAGDWLGIMGWHKDQRDVDQIELSTEQILNNGSINGAGIHAQLRRQAKDGVPSAKYLLERLTAYEKPVRGSGNVYTSLFQKHLDASYEWNAFRLVLVARRKVWDGSPENRAWVQSQLVKVWDKAAAKDTDRDNVLAWHKTNLSEWLVWRLGDYSFFTRMTPYQLKAQIVEWGAELAQFMPEIKPDLAARSKELEEYAAKMTDQEVKAEFERLAKANARFQTYIAQRQQQSADLSASIASMRKSMREFHIANLNISENAGSTGYRWTLKDN